jgi:iron complex outermembrane receptor protein
MYGAPDPLTPIFFDSVFTQNRHGVYAQDVFEITPALKGMAGVRYDRVHQKFDRELFPVPSIRDDQNFERWSPRAGLVFQPVPELLATYISYSESFDMPPGGARIQPNPIEPEVGRIWEAGIKANLFDNLTLTASGFHIQKDNQVFDDITLISTALDIRSQGAELSLVGRLTPHWSVVANYAYVDARITGDVIRPDRIGNRVRNVPYNSGNVWLKYDRQIHECQSIGAALGMVHSGARQGDFENTFELPSYTRWDAGVYYRCGRLRLAAYLENIFDQRYYTGSETPLIVFPGAPLNARGTVAWVF